MPERWIPALTHSITEWPLVYAARKPPTNESPAPLVSTI